MTVRARVAAAAVALVPAGFLAAFFAWPLAAILARGLQPASLVDTLTDPRVHRVVWFTVWQAAASTALTLLIALPGAFTLARFRLPGRPIMRAAATVPFVLPTVVVGTAFAGLLGRGGPLGSLDLYPGVAPVLAAHVFFNYAVVIRIAGGLLQHLDPRLEDAAEVLGASRWRATRDVTLPLLRPALAAAAAIVFLFTFTSFGVVLILGGPGRATLEVEIWRQTAQLLDLGQAAALAIIQLVFVVVALTVAGRLESRFAVTQPLRPAADVARRPRTARQWLFVTASLGAGAVLLGGPVATLVVRSLTPGHGWSLEAWRSLAELRRGSVLFVAPLTAALTSLRFAVAATAIAVFVGSCAAITIVRRSRSGARRRDRTGDGRAARAAGALDLLLMLPLGTSAVTLGFGFLISLDRPPLDLRASPVLIPIAHALVAVPFVVRTLVPVMRAVPERLREAAAVLGASPARARWEIDVPIVSRAALVGAGLAFAVSLGEFGATIFIARPDVTTMPVAIFRLLNQPGTFEQALAMSSILMAVTGTAVLLIERFRAGTVGAF